MTNLVKELWAISDELSANAANIADHETDCAKTLRVTAEDAVMICRRAATVLDRAGWHIAVDPARGEDEVAVYISDGRVLVGDEARKYLTKLVEPSDDGV